MAGQAAATVLLLLGGYAILWDGYADTGVSPPMRTLDEAVPTLAAGTAAAAWVWLRLFGHRDLAAVTAGIALVAVAVAGMAWLL